MNLDDDVLWVWDDKQEQSLMIWTRWWCLVSMRWQTGTKSSEMSKMMMSCEYEMTNRNKIWWYEQDDDDVLWVWDDKQEQSLMIWTRWWCLPSMRWQTGTKSIDTNKMMMSCEYEMANRNKSNDMNKMMMSCEHELTNRNKVWWHEQDDDVLWVCHDTQEQV